MALQEDFQMVCDFYQQLARENNVTLFDFTLVRPELLALEDSSFYDDFHMSGEGAAAFSMAASQVVADYIKGNEIDYDNLFYPSYQELLDASPYVFNAWLTKEEEIYTANCTFDSQLLLRKRKSIKKRIACHCQSDGKTHRCRISPLSR